MAIFAIGDMHLSLGTDKPMDVFPGWEGYLPRLEANWRKLIGPDDTVILAGDTSWAMNLNDTKADFAFIQSLPGQKWLLKATMITGGLRPVRWKPSSPPMALTPCISCTTMPALWTIRRCAAPAAGRLTTLPPRAKAHGAGGGPSAHVLAGGGGCGRKIAFLHYPPHLPGAQAQELVDVLNEFGVTECYYGHLHGKSIRYATQGERDGITYRLISADGLSFCPYKIR